MVTTPDDPRPPVDGAVETEPAPMEVEAPRRAASAQFVVDAEVGEQAALREAMDPANQSLAEALRLSYRVLQAVIVVLVVLFLFSGVKIVEPGQSGVKLRFGEVVPVRGSDALEPGRAWSLLPYPAGDYVTFQIENLQTDLGRVFWPVLAANQTEQQAIDRATTGRGLRPGHDGSVLTREGDLAHLRVTAGYEIADPVRFVKTMSPRDARRIVQVAVQRAVVKVAAALELNEVVEIGDAARAEIRSQAQATLDALHSGIDLTDVTVVDAKPPFAVVKAYQELQSAREQARRAVERARQQAEGSLIALAGPNYRRLAELIDAFEAAHEQGAGDVELAAVSAFLESPANGGRLAESIQRARAYESQVELTLGAEVKRFHSALPAYRERPEAVIKQRWLEAAKNVLARADAEIIYVPAGAGAIKIAVSGSEEVAKRRRENRIRARERRALEAFTPFDWTRRAADTEPGQARPLLDADEEGRLRPRGGAP